MGVLIPTPSADPLPTEYSPPFEIVLFTILVVFVVYLVGRVVVVEALTRLIRVRNPDNPTLVAATERYLQILTLVAALAAGAWAAGFGYVLSGGGLVVAALTLAIGVAGQEVIGNLVSGVFLVTDPDFNIDDWIRWEGGEGIVEAIRFRVTRVRTPNNEIITVPNTTLATTAVTRPYSRDRFRIVVRLALSTDQDIDTATATLQAAVDTTADALETPAPKILIGEIGDDAVWLHVEFWIANPSRGDVLQARSDAIEHMKERLQADDIKFSPPTDHTVTGQVQVDHFQR